MLLLKKDGLTRNERCAFQMLADTLIFNSPFEYELNKKNLPHIVEKLCREMIDLDTRSQRSLRLYTENMFSNVVICDNSGNVLEVTKNKNRSRVLDKTDIDLNMYLRELAATKKCKDRVFLTGFTKSYSCVSPLYEQYKYDKWGFTPRLAELSRKDDIEFGRQWNIRKNCFGTTIGLASYFRLRGLKFEFAITADHPYLIVSLNDGQKFAVSNSLPRRLHNKTVQRDGYKTYHPHKKDGLPHHMMLIHDFDNCVLYEILENMEMLRLISLGIDKTRLPETFDEGFAIANDFADILQKIDWKSLASKLFPDITRSIVENNDDWQKELEQMIPIRKQHHAENVFFLATKEAQKETEYKHFEYRKGQNAFYEELRRWRFEDDVVDYFRKDKAFTHPWMTSTIQAYFKVVKSALEKEKSDIREICIGLIEKKLIQKPNKQKTVEHEKIQSNSRFHFLQKQYDRGEANRRKRGASSSRNGGERENNTTT